ncbi:alkylmercury lyase [Mycolicibacterium elephantis]|uniref:alkylmercury lyase n=1 Tax=Mycolicibacterium elephantis TaxID=81858 RepID=UPI0009EE8C18|nr:alkylmercury lyase [Mycolicibacterium elephantis]
MRVEILYFDGCPNWQKCGERVHEALAAVGIADADVRYSRITTPDEAATSAFGGSPTVLIDGIDAFGAPPISDLACRIYTTETGLAGLPTVAQLTSALSKCAVEG